MLGDDTRHDRLSCTGKRSNGVSLRMPESELFHPVEEDPADVRNPQGIHIDGLELTPLGTATPNPEPAEDFFSTWDKEKPKAAAA